MLVEPGTILCFKTTGEMCLVLEDGMAKDGRANLKIRRPIMTKDNGIEHEEDIVYTFELETVEEHLRREAHEMVLKTEIQEELMEALEAKKARKNDKLLVN